MSQKQKVDRRRFLKTAARTAAATISFPYIIQSSALGKAGSTAPSSRIAIGCIGTGDQGTHNMKECLKLPDVQVVAVCDVNKEGGGYGWKKDQIAGREPARKIVEAYYAEQKPCGNYKGCAAYTDFRQLLERDDIDAVIVATPDHSHATIAMSAVKKRKHLFCQKPLTHTIYEARKLTETARQAGIATQMGNQGHCGEGIRLICEWLWDGAIGPVREVHCWTNRPKWPQGIDRPRQTPPVPEGLDWDLWLGPAPCRPYHPCYLPFNWRGWWDFGCGVLGDMGCHILDAPFWAIKLGHPESIEASSTKVNSETAPLASIVRYKFPARADMPPVELTWYDGGLEPARPAELEQGRKIGSGGVIFVGDKGKLMCDEHAGSPRLIPEARMKAYKQPPKTIPRSKGVFEDWILACKGGEPAGSNFDNAGHLTEVVLLGNIAIRVGQKLSWDGSNMKVTDVPEANVYLHNPYRSGWTL